MTPTTSAPVFGTDGIRGRFGTEVTLPLIRRLGAAAAVHLVGTTNVFVLGRDTRESSPRVAHALASGVADVAPTTQIVDLGVATTPLVSFACQQLECAGAVVTASHNPHVDNGVKLFAAGGRKLTGEAQARIAAQFDPETQPEPTQRAQPATSAATPAAARAVAPADLLAAYRESLAADTAATDLSGLSVVVDCAHGAVSPYAQDLLGSLGADVTVLCAEPDGRNINDACGSAAPETMAATVVATGAQLGIALDGDGDRLIACDEAGTLINGDRLMALFALDMASRGELAKRTLVTTVMSNGGLDLALLQRGVSVVRTRVGDRHVLDALDERGANLGGEQSGHIIFYDRCATGDGLRAGVRLMALMRCRNEPLSSIAGDVIDEFPQVLTNVAVSTVLDVLPDDLRAEIDQLAGAALARVLVRPSGTEPVVRVMVESPDEAQTQRLAELLTARIAARLT